MASQQPRGRVENVPIAVNEKTLWWQNKLLFGALQQKVVKLYSHKDKIREEILSLKSQSPFYAYLQNF